MKFFALLGIHLFAQIVHLDELYFVGIGHRRIDSLPVHELAGLRHEFHTLVVEKEIDKRLGGVGMRGFVAESHVAGVAEKLFRRARNLDRRPLLAMEKDIVDVGEADGSLPSQDAVGGRVERLHQDRFLSGQFADELVCLLLADKFVDVGEPLGGRGVLRRVGHDQFAAVLGLEQIFEGFGRVRRFDDALIVDECR